MDRILRLPEVLSTVGISRSSLYALIAQGQFPRQIRLSPRTSGWRLSDVEDWIRAKAECGR
ncbi:MAG: phage DNA binding protein [Leptospirillum sp. Group II 'C75']|jgi:prophage regulatory protein|uniref:Phage DNA binding protein n=1 Tax=Leptospirillum sp. Group II '5-way CG' TaxID=419541 RepID=B6AMX6_9BACT|nr:AlpA family phage regulatory protein [Leptospirillum sp. Group II 'CF-1']AKS22498.1 hypothetical protein ABH19_00060 [Leptospirillum sp. Group II 'CF-1']EDZ39826.1 MAG: phage DNA binding protein [Leptospirillum sp. Group II '5-way CG']EIJ75870.1 MAG: phage DNA binding protein [Leptospirillum sp. Group II 'C75']